MTSRTRVQLMFLVSRSEFPDYFETEELRVSKFLGKYMGIEQNKSMVSCQLSPIAYSVLYFSKLGTTGDEGN